MRSALLALSLLVLTPAAWGAGVDFDRAVAPVLARRCLGCHSGPEPRGGLDLSSRAAARKGGKNGPAVAPGDPGESLLWQQVDGDEMPPKAPLPASEKVALKGWIAAGAVWGTDPIDTFATTSDRRAGRDWWSFQPVARPDPPAVRDAGWCATPVDRFVLRRLEDAGLAPSPPAGRPALIRRLTFDLLGLPPTPGEVDAFASDGRPDAYDRLVDRLLASPQYGVRWARLWLDLARYGESNGFEHDEFRPDAWPYRDWVVNALNRDTPYDEFARLQLAGDLLRPDDPAAAEATGFLVAGGYDSVGQTQQSEAMRRVVRQDELEDLVGTVGQTFLGLTVHCARCHDHKFDPIRQAEYYRLTSALGGVRQGERDLTPLDPEARAERRRLDALLDRLEAVEDPARSGLPAPPRPLARWDFDRGPADRNGRLDATPRGGATLGPDGLRLDGKTAHATAPLPVSLTAKTLEAWVRLDNLDQRGGGVLGVQTPEGARFDALVFAEQEPGRWTVGSENFTRTKPFQGPEETEAHRRPVHLALTYADDGTIAAYRDGLLYGTPYRASPPAAFPAGTAQIVFGLRHAVPAGNRMLAGRIVRARLYDRALTPAEVAASAAAGSVTDAFYAAHLTPDRRAERSRLLAELRALQATPARVRRAHAVVPADPGPTRILLRGDAGLPGALVSAGGVAALNGLNADFGLPPDAPEAPRRLRLAAWVTDPRNPLFARVIVNRLWQSHFGTGLVETPSDFGFNGGHPSHPELLDWLAAELPARGWSLKAVHRLIVTSSTYRQSSRSNPAAARADAAGRLLWRKAPQRLEAEMVRDAMLAASGALDPTLGGPGFREFAVSRAEGTATNRYTPADPDTPGFDRRTLYRTWPRGGRSGFLDAFDCPDPSTTAPRRSATTTPLQVLALWNNALTLRMADRFAARLRREAGPDPARMADLAFRLALGRPPDDSERAEAARVAAESGPAVLARAIFNSNEFLYLD